MSGKVKDLYVAECMDSLNKCVGNKMDDVRKMSAKKSCAWADRFFIEAKQSMACGDEERAYVLYMKYMETFSSIRKKSDYKADAKYYDSLLGTKKFETSVLACERLQKCLEARYKLRREEAEAKVLLEKKEQQLSKNKKSTKRPSATAPSSSDKNSASSGSGASSSCSSAQDSASISCPALQSLLQQRSASLLIVDIRPAEDFTASRLTAGGRVLSVPAELLRAGVTAPALERQLPDEARQLFARRGSVDQLIVLDWTGAGPGLKVLLDSMLRWDVVTTYRAQPRVLDGGYRMWLHTYPLLTTDPHVQPPAGDSSAASLSSAAAAVYSTTSAALSVLYPSLDEQPPEPPSLKPPDDSSSSSSSLSGSQQLDLNSQLAGLRVSSGSSPSSTALRSSPAAPAVPGVPSRALKPQLDATSAARRSLEMAKSRLDAEQQWQLTRVSREHQLETQMREQLQDREEVLLANIERMKMEQTQWDGQHQLLRDENETLKARLARYEQGSAKYPSATSSTTSVDQQNEESSAETQKLQAEIGTINAEIVRLERLRNDRAAAEKARKAAAGGSLVSEQEAGRRALEETQRRREQEAAAMRKAMEEEREKKRQESELVRIRFEEAQKLQEETRLHEEAKKRREELQEKELLKKRQDEAAAVKKLEEQDALLRRQEKAEEDTTIADVRSDSFVTRLKDADAVGAGGGGGLKRSHSSPYIAQLGRGGETDPTQLPGNTPTFSRDNKPLSRTKRGDPQAARARHFAPAYGSVGAALTGLKNLGNTCYMNAVVQSVNCTPGLNDFFVQDAYQDFVNYENEMSRGAAVQELAAVVKALWSGHFRSIAMYDMKEVMGRLHPPFHGTNQHDAHEFLMYLLDYLHEDLNEIKRKNPLKEQENDDVSEPKAAQNFWSDFTSNNRSFILNLFWGQLKSTVRCSRCGNQSIKFEAFSHLSVPMPERSRHSTRSGRCSLQECIRLYMAGDTIEGWRCPRCNNSIQATKTLDVWRLPPILIIHLQRFYNDGLWRKKQSIVDFPLDGLDMSSHVINSQARYRCSSYQLYGVVNHYGSMESGHYTAFCRHPTTSLWHKFDDHEVYQMKSSAVHTSAGYILFYSAIDSKL